MTDLSPSVAACMSDMAAEILALRARLAAVEALAQMVADADAMLTGKAVLAAVRGESDRG